nr:MAG TPA: hypothetical protein [Bacteriophage sp.]DAX01485.1 MAG TPA: hypothetical protein [Bacteriophage sp.]
MMGEIYEKSISYELERGKKYRGRNFMLRLALSVVE